MNTTQIAYETSRLKRAAIMIAMSNLVLIALAVVALICLNNLKSQWNVQGDSVDKAANVFSQLTNSVYAAGQGMDVKSAVPPFVRFSERGIVVQQYQCSAAKSDIGFAMVMFIVVGVFGALGIFQAMSLFRMKIMSPSQQVNPTVQP